VSRVYLDVRHEAVVRGVVVGDEVLEGVVVNGGDVPGHHAEHAAVAVHFTRTGSRHHVVTAARDPRGDEEEGTLLSANGCAPFAAGRF